MALLEVRGTNFKPASMHSSSVSLQSQRCGNWSRTRGKKSEISLGQKYFALIMTLSLRTDVVLFALNVYDIYVLLKGLTQPYAKNKSESFPSQI